MNLLAIVGSLRKSSYNRRVFKHYQKMAGNKVDLQEGRHDDFPLYNEDIREKAMPESVTRLGQQIREAAGILIFSPEYNYSIPGVLKNTLDWLSKLPTPSFAGKPVAVLSASPGKLGGARMQYHLRQVAVTLDMRMLNKPEVMISEVHKKFNAEGELIDADTAKFLLSHFEQFQKFIGEQ